MQYDARHSGLFADTKKFRPTWLQTSLKWTAWEGISSLHHGVCQLGRFYDIGIE
ncbi:predicted protein [Histoplasma mississippiense (nom. inval.)]|uniref:predicted protein n=1 Tax=Ajellomyces capsulatus (strain NAm1 / WU24) TaxID=2059318 RepID=UPI000157C243|nr:predicted protein [Histoplasma mississippiense (nom. inval.)]EDN07613.1 predicted protein [Histoplasma mississippiense (nom. inval.)]